MSAHSSRRYPGGQTGPVDPLQKPTVVGHEQRPPRSLRPHEFELGFPALGPGEYEQLREDIGRRGIISPLDINADDIVLDGRERLRAARELELDLVPVRVMEVEDERAYAVLSLLRRSHLDATQRTVIALEHANLASLRAAAEDRKVANLSAAPERAPAPTPGRVRKQIADLSQAGERTAEDVIKVYERDPDLYEQLKAGAISAKKAARRVRQRELAERFGEAPPLPDGLFQLIYADPPWESPNPDCDWMPENHYPTMPLEDIKALGEKLPLHENCVCFLWALACNLPDAFDVLEAWGFRVVGGRVWVKESIGPGRWARYRHEHLLIAVRGKISPPPPELRFDSVIEAPRGPRHSQKPECVYEDLERAYPHLSRLELFARPTGEPRRGWVQWGNEVKS